MLKAINMHFELELAKIKSNQLARRKIKVKTGEVMIQDSIFVTDKLVDLQ